MEERFLDATPESRKLVSNGSRLYADRVACGDCDFGDFGGGSYAIAWAGKRYRSQASLPDPSFGDSHGRHATVGGLLGVCGAVGMEELSCYDESPGAGGYQRYP